MNELRQCQNQEDKNDVYKNSICTNIKSKFDNYFKELNTLITSDKFKSNKHPNTKEKNSNLYNNINIPNFASCIYVMCCFLDNKEINEFTNFLIKYLTSIKTLITFYNDNFINEQNNDSGFDYFYKKYPTFKIKNINDLIKCLYIIQQLFKSPHSNQNEENKDSNSICKKLIHKLFNKPPNDDSKINEKLITLIAKNRNFIYIIKHVNLSICKNFFNNTQLIEYIVSKQINHSQKGSKNDYYIANEIFEL